MPISEIKAELFKALAHPARIRVLEVLAEGERSVGELQPLVGHRVVAPLAAAGRAAPGRAGHDPQGRLVGVSTRSAIPQLVELLAVAKRLLINSLAETEDLLADLRRRMTARTTAALVGRVRRAAAPPRATTRGCARSWRGDVVAGVTVGVVALPLALAFGITTGLGADAGLMTAIVAGLVAAVFGGSNVQVSGPTGAMTVVLVPIVARYGADAVFVVGADGRRARRSRPRSRGSAASSRTSRGR